MNIAIDIVAVCNNYVTNKPLPSRSNALMSAEMA